MHSIPDSRRSAAPLQGMEGNWSRFRARFCSPDGKDCLRRVAAILAMLFVWLLAVGVVSLFFPSPVAGSAALGPALQPVPTSSNR